MRSWVRRTAPTRINRAVICRIKCGERGGIKKLLALICQAYLKRPSIQEKE